RERILRPFEVVAGRMSEGEGEIIVEESLARSAGIGVDDSVKLLTRRSVQPVPMRVVGLIRPADIWSSRQGGLAYLVLEEWQWLCKAEEKIDALQIALAPGADRDKVLDSLAAGLPAELQLRRARSPTAGTNVTLVAFEHGLEVSQLLALAV